MKNSVKDMEGKSELLSLKMRYSPYWASLVAQTVKRLPTTQETWVQSLGGENALEKEMATHSSILARRILKDDCQKTRAHQ